MTSISDYLKENLPSACDAGRLYLAPEIPGKKLNAAVSAFEFSGEVGAIIAVVDTTAFGSGKNGILLTGERVIIRNLFEDPYSVNYDDIKSVEIAEEKICVELKSGAVLAIDKASEFDQEKFFEILNHIVTSEMDYQEVNQLITIAEMPEPLKLAYLKIVVNSTFFDDGEVDSKEFSEILMLMTRMELQNETRFSLRSYIAAINQGGGSTVEDLIIILDENCSADHIKSVHVSVIKDLISVFKSTKDASLSDFKFLSEYKKLFSITDDEIELAVMAIDNDRKMISGDYDDDAITKSVKELSAKAAAVGLPLGAVYLSGSVAGMSAAGLTSGLASIGMGGALGLSSMASGIGVAVLLGVGAYKGMKHLTGANEIDKSKRRALMLTEVIKQTQKTTSLLMSDINYLVSQLNGKDVQLEKMSVKTALILKQIKAHAVAGELIGEKTQGMQASNYKLQCPKFLDVARFENLTDEPNKKAIKELVINGYFLSKAGETEGKWLMKENLEAGYINEMAGAFKVIGYFDVTADISGTAAKLKDETTSKIKSFFS